MILNNTQHSAKASEKIWNYRPGGITSASVSRKGARRVYVFVSRYHTHEQARGTSPCSHGRLPLISISQARSIVTEKIIVLT